MATVSWFLEVSVFASWMISARFEGCLFVLHFVSQLMIFSSVLDAVVSAT